MPKIRNRSSRALEVAGRVYPAGEPVEVGDNEAAYLLSNPNFQRVAEVVHESDDTERPQAGKRGKK